jgi:hypothetical protein
LPDGRAAGGRPIKMLTLIDEFTKQALAIHLARRAYRRAGSSGSVTIKVSAVFAIAQTIAAFYRKLIP